MQFINTIRSQGGYDLQYSKNEGLQPPTLNAGQTPRYKETPELTHTERYRWKLSA